MLIDTHAHLNFAAYKNDLEEVIKRCSDQKVGVINVGSEYKTSRRAVEMAQKYENLWAAIGLHPIHLSSSTYYDKIDDSEEIEFKPSTEEYDMEKYRELAKNPKVVAVGEVGLDYFHDKENIEHQKEIFKKQIKLAVEFNLPIIIHCRDAYKDVLEIIQEEKKKYGEKLRGVVHSYLGRLSQAKDFIDAGFYLGFNGIVTFARDYDKVLKNISLENILIETDCPYLTPLPHRGKRNDPTYVRFVAEKIAEVKKVDFKSVSEATSENAKKLFGI